MQDELKAAFELHKAGRLSEAEAVYRQCLSQNPNHPGALHLLGLIAHQTGHHEKAAALVERAIEQDSGVAAYHEHLATIYQALGRIDAAVAAYRRVLAINENDLAALFGIGRLLNAKGDLASAEASLRKVISLQPNHAQAWTNLGLVLQTQGRLTEARDAFQAAIRFAPQLPAAHSNLGNVLRLLGNYPASAASHETAVQLAPQVPLVHLNYADLLQDRGQHERAAEMCAKAVDLDTENPQLHVSYGRMLRAMGNHEAAASALRSALALQPALVEAHSQLGQTLAEMGDAAEAVSCYRQALELDRNHALALVNLGTYHTDDLGDEEMAHLLQLAGDERVPAGARSGLNFAAAAVRDHQDDFAGAATHLRAANRLQKEVNERRGRRYDPQGHEAHVLEIISAFDADFFARAVTSMDGPWGIASDLLVSILGMPRAGTSLTEQILAAHPQVHAAGELRLLQPSLQAALAQVEQVPQLRERLSKLTRPTVEQSAQTFLDRLTALSNGAQRVTDKLPENYMYLGWLVTLFPNATILHCRRMDPAVAFSCWQTSFEGIVWANDAEHILSRLKQHHRLMEHWTEAIGDRMLAVDYEQTVKDIEPTARKLLDYIGLDWNERCLRFHEVERPVQTASVSQVRQPISPRSVDRWERYVEYFPELLARSQRR